MLGMLINRSIEMKQVNKSHYDFRAYMQKPRWCSIWHQLDELLKIEPDRVLEIGPGPGVLKVVARQFGLKIETLDLDPELQPDHLGSATEIPLEDASFDAVCAFQMLEHLPYESSLKAFGEMLRVSRRYVIISLPDAKPVWRYRLHIPKIGAFDFLLSRPTLRKHPVHVFDGEHYWEINKRGYSLKRVIEDYSGRAILRKTFRVRDNPYHRFFVFEKMFDDVSVVSSVTKQITPID